MGTLGKKRELLERGRFKYNFERMIYFNRESKMAFSVEYIEDNDADEIERRIKNGTARNRWRFYFNKPPSESVKRQLESDLA